MAAGPLVQGPATALLVNDSATIADIANYTYVAHAPEGGLSLDAYPPVRAWLQRIEALPGFVPMQSTPVGLLRRVAGAGR